MPNSGYAFGDQPALDEIAHTDLLLDALADRERIDLDDPQVDALAVLMGDWRDDLRWPPASALVSAEEAVEALRTGLAERRRTHRGLAAIASVAATLLVLSGFGAFVADAHRGDPLYGLHVMFFDAPRVNDDQITLSAKAELAKVQQMIDQGQWAQAQNQLAEVSSTVQSINDGNSRQNLLDEVNLLNTRVESRNPNATLPGPATKPKASAASTTPATTSAPSTVASSTAPIPSSPAPSGRRRHHGQNTDPSVAPSVGP
ncbi:MAG: anti-sigma-D factor RsdA [Mycobacterium sp.]|uniref:anti-sigma-D factor RsdA n=1 Tax=Mycobacterium sp. TaxID=1785 RepID=UPI003C3B435A